MATPAPRGDIESRAKERYKRTRRLEWSIVCRESDMEDLGRMVELLKEALKQTRDELYQLERELGYKIKE